MLLSFQWMEERLLHVACAAESRGDDFVTSDVAEEHRFTDIADRARTSGQTALNLWAGDAAPDLVKALEQLVTRARELSRERNRLVHAAFFTMGPRGEEVLVFFRRGRQDDKLIDDSRLGGLIEDLDWCAEQFRRATMTLLHLKVKYEQANGRA
jgi:hypothetical protein